MEAQKTIKEKPAPVKRKASTDEPEMDAKKKDVVSSFIIYTISNQECVAKKRKKKAKNKKLLFVLFLRLRVRSHEALRGTLNQNALLVQRTAVGS